MGADFFPLVTCAIVNYSLDNGICTESATAFSSFGYFLIHLLGKYDSGKYWGGVAENILVHSDRPNIRAGLGLNGFLFLWFKPLKELADELFRLNETAMKVGDIDGAMYTAAFFSKEAFSFPMSKTPKIQLIFHYFYHGLTSFWLYRDGQGDSYLDEGKNVIKKMEVWRANSPCTFENKLFLLQAEHLASLSDKDASIEMYEMSIKTARDNGFLHEQGLGHELMGNYLSTVVQLSEAILSQQTEKAKPARRRSSAKRPSLAQSPALPSSRKLTVRDIRMNVQMKSKSENNKSDKDQRRVSFYKIFDGSEVDHTSPWASFLDDDSDSDDQEVKARQEQKEDPSQRATIG